MNVFIEQELSKCKIANVEKISDTEFIVKQKNNLEPIIGNGYEIELEDYIINPSPGFTLADNWNKGVVPKSKKLDIVVVQTMGKMIKVDGTGDHSDSYFGLWLPLKGVKFLKHLTNHN